jgi:hypothetical protein
VIPSDPLSFVVWRQTVAGTASLGKVAADFSVLGYDDGTYSALTVSSVTEGATVGPVGNQWRSYAIALAAIPATIGYIQIRVEPASGMDLISPQTVSGEIEAYDLDSLAGLLLTSTGVPAVQSAADGELGDIVMGDAWRTATLTVPLGKISPWGYSDLTGMTISAGARKTPGVPSTPAVISATIVDSASRTFYLSFDTFPAAMDLGSTETQVDWFIDVQLKHTASARIITSNRYHVRVVWQRDITA